MTTEKSDSSANDPVQNMAGGPETKAEEDAKAKAKKIEKAALKKANKSRLMETGKPGLNDEQLLDDSLLEDEGEVNSDLEAASEAEKVEALDNEEVDRNASGGLGDLVDKVNETEGDNPGKNSDMVGPIPMDTRQTGTLKAAASAASNMAAWTAPSAATGMASNMADYARKRTRGGERVRHLKIEADRIMLHHLRNTPVDRNF